MTKKILIALIALVAVLGVGGALLKSDLNESVQKAIVKYGAASTQATVKLDGVKILVKNGIAAIAGLGVGNPADFSDEKALSFGSVFVQIDTDSLKTKGPLVIKSIVIDKPQINYEINANGQSNLQVLVNNVQAYLSKLSRTTGVPGEVKEESKAGPLMIIGGLMVTNAQALISTAPLQGKKLSVNLPPIQLANIGKNENGIVPERAAQAILGAISATTAHVAGEALAKEFAPKPDTASVGGADQKPGDDLQKNEGEAQKASEK